MSKRTSEANKAVRKAWENEQQLVLEGKGTRDWTPEQQQSIIDMGKAYDDEGRAFEGHHMKSAEAFPEYQGDAENIQFLTRMEHQDAHGGSFRNPTNGYYDPTICATREFCENKYEPCEIIKLSEPIVNTSVMAGDAAEYIELSPSEGVNIAEQETEIINQASTIQARSELTQKATATPKSPLNIKSSLKADGGVVYKIIHTIEAIKEFRNKHPVLTAIGKGVGGAVVSGVVAKVINSSGKSSNNNLEYSLTTDSDESEDNSNEFVSVENVALNIQRDYPDERSSPRKHEVSGHWQHYGKDKELKWVDQYSRGAGKDS